MSADDPQQSSQERNITPVREALMRFAPKNIDVMFQSDEETNYFEKIDIQIQAVADSLHYEPSPKYYQECVERYERIANISHLFFRELTDVEEDFFIAFKNDLRTTNLKDESIYALEAINIDLGFKGSSIISNMEGIIEISRLLAHFSKKLAKNCKDKIPQKNSLRGKNNIARDGFSREYRCVQMCYMLVLVAYGEEGEKLVTTTSPRIGVKGESISLFYKLNIELYKYVFGIEIDPHARGQNIFESHIKNVKRERKSMLNIKTLE